VTNDAFTFLGIVLVLTIMPGADMALVMRHVLQHGRGAAWPTLLGIETGLLVHVTACVAGLSLLLRDSQVAFTTVQLAGAAWLVWLGIGAIATAMRGRSGQASDHVGDVGGDLAATTPARFRTLYVRGLLTNLLNVKIALFYIAFLPQFAPQGERFVPVALTLALVQAAIGLAWLALYAVLVARAGDALQSRPRARRWLEYATGSALVGFGLRLASVGR
jgi:threonine/homoserine/homoserine lactone efflux protein